MKKEKDGMKKKNTVYAIMVEQFLNAGYEVKEDSWQETMPYEEPTTEYWFDVILKRKGNTVYTLHHWFGSDLNKLIYVECWTHDLLITEVNHQQIC